MSHFFPHFPLLWAFKGNLKGSAGDFSPVRYETNRR